MSKYRIKLLEARVDHLEEMFGRMMEVIKTMQRTQNSVVKRCN